MYIGEEHSDVDQPIILYANEEEARREEPEKHSLNKEQSQTKEQTADTQQDKDISPYSIEMNRWPDHSNVNGVILIADKSWRFS